MTPMCKLAVFLWAANVVWSIALGNWTAALATTFIVVVYLCPGIIGARR